MKTESGLYYGGVPGEVGIVLSQHFQQLPVFRSAMVLSIDSSSTAFATASILAHYDIDARIEAASAVLTPDQLYRAARRNIFVCFDEVWLLESDAPTQEVPRRNRLPSDLENMRRLIPAVEARMKDARCVLALASGFGLGYATWDATFAALIEAQFLGRGGEGP